MKRTFVEAKATFYRSLKTIKELKEIRDAACKAVSDQLHYEDENGFFHLKSEEERKNNDKGVFWAYVYAEQNLKLAQQEMN